jgi:hypothetical protein
MVPLYSAFLTLYPDPGREKIWIRVNILDHISESPVTIFWPENTPVLCCGSGPGIQCLLDPGSGIQHEHPGSATVGLKVIDRYF